MKTIRVLVVEDSPVVAEHLRRIISADPRLEMAGIASSGEEALTMVERVSPDVISMDIHLPGMQGFEATRRIMTKHPTPIVIVSGSVGSDVPITMRALHAGALAVVEKPRAATGAGYSALASKLCTQLAIMSEVKVVRQREAQGQWDVLPEPPSAAPLVARAPFKVVGIGASTGGPSALMQVLSGLGREFSLPVVVVQHMTPGFMQGFADWLASVVPLPVSVVSGPTPLLDGRIYLAPSNDCHVAVRDKMAYPEAAAPSGVHRPSANVLFSSMAQSLGPAGIGILLTGMGEDGAVGLADMKRSGAWAIAEHESTATVYGMPGAAVRIGAVHECLPLPQIAPRVLEVVAMGREAAR